MTINVVLATRDALVLGCDSVASTTKAVVTPWTYVDKDAEGNPIKDEQGRTLARLPPDCIEWVVTDARGGATKMFELCQTGSNVAATTAGMAALNGRSIHNYAMQFLQESRLNPNHETVSGVAEHFLQFMRAAFDEHYAKEQTPDAFRSDVEFLVGGYGIADHFPSLFRLRVLANTCESQYAPGQFGISWAGQSDGVARLIFGYDHLLKRRAQRGATKLVDDTYKQFSESVAAIVAELLGRLGAELPEGANTTLPDKPKFDFDWEEFQLDIEVANLPIQDAVDLVSYLVNLQSGRAKFARGVATVGGRTRLGVITRGSSLRMLNEPEIVHRSTGFAVDI